MKYFVIVFLSLVSSFTFCQSNKKLHSIQPKWKPGDIKMVQTVSLTKIYIKDSLLNNTETKVDCIIKVIDTSKYFKILFSYAPNTFNIKTSSSNLEVDSVIGILASITKKIENETKSFEYEIIVDKLTGHAIKINNSEELLKIIQKISTSIIDEFRIKFKFSKIQTDSINQKLVSVFKTKEPKIIETILNEFNYIMGAYSLKFPYNSSISQKALVHDVNALGDFGDVEIPAIITTSSIKRENYLSVQTETDYDKDSLLTQIKKKYNNMNELKPADIFLSEKTNSSFTTISNWIVSQNSKVIFQTKEVRVILDTQVNFH